MTKEDWKAFSELIGRTFALYQRPALSKDEMRLYFDALADLPIEAVAEGIRRHVRGVTGDAGRFAPKPADIILALFGTPEQQAAAAWTYVKRSLKDIGIGRSVRFDDPRIHFALESCGGWTGLCMSTIDMEGRFRRAFLSATQRCIGWGDVADHFRGTDEENGYLSWTPEKIENVRTMEFAPVDLRMLGSGSTAER